MQSIMWFNDLAVGDAGIAGGKGANLGELTAAGLPVPPGFVLTSAAYLAAVSQAGIRDELQRIRRELRAGEDEALEQAADAARKLIENVRIPSEIAQAVRQAYAVLGVDEIVAVRSSGTVEDSAAASFAGMNATFTNVRGPDALLRRIVDCWASLYGARSMAYRAQAGIQEEPTIAVIVQRMVPSQTSGIMFTADPATGERGHLVIEAVRGQGEAIVSGMVEPDTYRVSKEPLAVDAVRIGHQKVEIVRAQDGTEQVRDLDAATGDARVLADDAVLEIARLGLAVEAHYGSPQDVEWAAADGKVWLVQSRPVTTLGGHGSRESSPAAAGGSVLLRGLAASAGQASGAVRVLHDPSEGRSLRTGEVLVAPMTSPDWVPAMRRAAALITDGGGMTCHAAIVSRELGLPCVVGAREATTVLHDGDVVTVDGGLGEVREGTATTADASTPAGNLLGHPTVATVASSRQETLATRLYANLAVAANAEAVAALDVEGVGLLRAEFMVADALQGVHPRLLIERGQQKTFVDAMAEGISRITRAFGSRPVVYRSIDFRSNEFSGLEGGDRFEPQEANPMIGYRGCFRYVDQPELFELELDVLGAVAGRTPNLRLMIP
ncbi:MAG TPA: phosphoenolpyruvate synthase, partial [Jatrophihabitans sp.]|nr:phosphoenolpyruvate synthase [Jatrophihabitans sp.]